MEDFPHELRHPSGQMMSLARDLVLVGLKESQAPSGPEKVLNRLGVVLEDPVGHRGSGTAVGEGRPMQRVNHTATRFWARTKDGSAFGGASLADVAKSAEGRAIDWIAPVYSLNVRGRTELLSILPHVLLVRPDRKADPDELAKHLSGYGLQEDPQESKPLPPL